MWWGVMEWGVVESACSGVHMVGCGGCMWWGVVEGACGDVVEWGVMEGACGGVCGDVVEWGIAHSSEMGCACGGELGWWWECN